MIKCYQFNSLTLKIVSLTPPQSWYIFPSFEDSVLDEDNNFYLNWWIIYGYYTEKLHVDNFWELKGQVEKSSVFY